MKIVDNSLCNIDFSKKVSNEQMINYINSLFKIGVDFVELDGNAMQYLPESYDDEGWQFILRIERPDDFALLTKRQFYYVVLQSEIYTLAKKFPMLNIMIEINGDNYNSVDEILALCVKIQEQGCASAIRIVKEFGNDTKELTDFIKQYRRLKMYIPLDICPLNKDLSGLNNAYAAKKSNVDMLTLCFGSPYLFTSLESYALYMHQNTGRDSFNGIPSHFLILSLYEILTNYNLISNGSIAALRHIDDYVRDYQKNLICVDAEFDSLREQRRQVGKKDDENFYSFSEKIYFEDNDLDEEACAEISRAIDECTVSVFNPFKNKFRRQK